MLIVVGFVDGLRAPRTFAEVGAGLTFLQQVVRQSSYLHYLSANHISPIYYQPIIDHLITISQS